MKSKSWLRIVDCSAVSRSEPGLRIIYQLFTRSSSSNVDSQLPIANQEKDSMTTKNRIRAKQYLSVQTRVRDVEGSTSAPFRTDHTIKKVTMLSSSSSQG